LGAFPWLGPPQQSRPPTPTTPATVYHHRTKPPLRLNEGEFSSRLTDLCEFIKPTDSLVTPSCPRTRGLIGGDSGSVGVAETGKVRLARSIPIAGARIAPHPSIPRRHASSSTFQYLYYVLSWQAAGSGSRRVRTAYRGFTGSFQILAKSGEKASRDHCGALRPKPMNGLDALFSPECCCSQRRPAAIFAGALRQVPF